MVLVSSCANNFSIFEEHFHVDSDPFFGLLIGVLAVQQFHGHHKYGLEGRLTAVPQL
jgi:hypothetical protein